MTRRVNIIVSGKVQGVYFRAATQKQAQKLGVKGWVRNMASGEVEVNAVGKISAIEQLIHWCYKGTTFARVEKVVVTESSDVEEFAGFEIRKDSF